jgi:hypothetical protein
MGKAETYIARLQQPDIGGDVFLFANGECFPPSAERVGVFDDTCHQRNIPVMAYLVKAGATGKWSGHDILATGCGFATLAGIVLSVRP